MPLMMQLWFSSSLITTVVSLASGTRALTTEA